MDYDYTLNSTKAYHMNHLSTLGWELTVCNALYPTGTPLRKVLKRNESYGALLYEHLASVIPMDRIEKVLEIGGGYGFLMKDFLDKNPGLKPCMLDLSPTLLQKQREVLNGYEVSYKEEDFLETDLAAIGAFDLAILNENLGDFPTLISLPGEAFRSPLAAGEGGLHKAFDLFRKYGFDLPENDRFNLNVGAIEAVEKLCASGIPYIFLGEHSCEAQAPERLASLVPIVSTGNPERISLMGHDEYSLRMSYLERVAEVFGYTCKRGPFADFVEIDVTERIKVVLLSRGRHKDDDEIICHFIEDLYKYEYLILAR
jgi:hypothetical protein